VIYTIEIAKEKKRYIFGLLHEKNSFHTYAFRLTTFSEWRLFMFTFKQLEAIYWVIEAGGFAQAAQKLHTTQSAISKRVQELENLFEIDLFERNHHTARLTEKGETMFVLAQRLLAQREIAVDQIGRPESHVRRLKMGITEFSTITWLPKFCGRLWNNFPNIEFKPIVKSGVDLYDSLLAKDVDLIVIPDVFKDVRLSSIPLGKVRFGWMCKPGIIRKKKKKITVPELASQQLLVQGDKSLTGRFYGEWFKKVGLSPRSCITSNNLLVGVGMTVAGLGISYLPVDCLSKIIESELLEEIESNPPLPEIPYAAMYLCEQKSSLISSIVTLVQEYCDFSRMFGIDVPSDGI
jgi:DNA-binding transcriptional LysR family regulator